MLFLSKIKSLAKKILRPTHTSADLENLRQKMLKNLKGDGLEIGALHRPCHVPHLKVKYVDRLSRADLLKQYPELSNENIVDPDILDDAETLGKVSDNSQDFVIANHVIEHMANPIGTLVQWSRVLKPGGRLFLAVPDKHTTFDKARPFTTLEHLFNDYQNPEKSNCYTHFQEFAREVSCKIFNVKPVEQAEVMAQELWDKQYSIHYHVWDFNSFNTFLNAVIEKVPGFNMHVISSMPTAGMEFIYVLEKKA